MYSTVLNEQQVFQEDRLNRAKAFKLDHHRREIEQPQVKILYMGYFSESTMGGEQLMKL